LDYVTEAERDLSKIDSAKGDYRSAYLHFLKHVSFHDKVFDETQIKSLQDIKIKYETRDKEQSIKLLQAGKQLDHTELERIGLQRNLTFGGLLALLVVSGLAYNGYRNKRHSNNLLSAQQLVINEKNNSLEKTLTEKDHLLSDKDLLLKEVNHRVKNNLHIVMSLLESQSAYLDNNAALEAIRDSQNRVQSIALIHQKLYNSVNITRVDMQSYIPELIDYLNNSINTGAEHIVISHDISLIELDVSQAIPVGIILNEGITNAIKYAFPARRAGEIMVQMRQIGDKVALRISDNGVGLPANFDSKDTKSLGMNLIKGLTNQLKGTFSMSGDHGVNLLIEFSILLLGT
jgi:two-component sensor histidine kinase